MLISIKSVPALGSFAIGRLCGSGPRLGGARSPARSRVRYGRYLHAATATRMRRGSALDARILNVITETSGSAVSQLVPCRSACTQIGVH